MREDECVCESELVSVCASVCVRERERELLELVRSGVQ